MRLIFDKLVEIFILHQGKPVEEFIMGYFFAVVVVFDLGEQEALLFVT